MIFDTHAHYDDEAFDEDRHSLIPKLFESGVTRIIDVACDVRTADRTIELIDRYPFIYGTVGMHPHDVSAMDNAMMDIISDILQHKKMLALGEIGLDYHYDLSPRDCQRKWFAEQLELAKQLGYPVVLHIREAFGDCMDILHAHRDGLRGVMHCYSGSAAARQHHAGNGLPLHDPRAAPRRTQPPRVYAPYGRKNCGSSRHFSRGSLLRSL